MRIDADIEKQKPEIVVRHRDRSLHFQANVFTRKPFIDTDVYREINDFWEAKPMEFQDAVWEIYVSIDQAFSEIFDSKDLTNHLRECIKRLYEFHPLGELEQFLIQRNVKIPSSAKDEPPQANDIINTVEKTYTKREYLELIAFSLFLRCVTPVWGEFIGSIRRDAGVDRKENVGMQLLMDTGLFETRAMIKLSTYITKLTAGAHNDQGKIIAGFSSEDIPFLHLALACVRKVCVANIDTAESSEQIVAVIFKFISHRMNSVDSQRIIAKEESGGGGGGEEKHSLLESYRKRIQISAGEFEEIRFVLSRPLEIVQYLEPDIPVELVIRSMSTAQVLKYEEVNDIQLYMAGWLLKPYITPKAVFYADKEIHASLLGALEALLWHRGHKYFAIMISSCYLTNLEEMMISSISSREQIRPDLREELQKWFPYYCGYAKKGKDAGQIERSDITTAIDYIVDEIVNSTFRATADEDKLKEVFGEVKRRLPVFSDIRSMLAKLMIDNEQRISKLPKDPFEGFQIPDFD